MIRDELLSALPRLRKLPEQVDRILTLTGRGELRIRSVVDEDGRRILRTLVNRALLAAIGAALLLVSASCSWRRDPGPAVAERHRAVRDLRVRRSARRRRAGAARRRRRRPGRDDMSRARRVDGRPRSSTGSDVDWRRPLAAPAVVGGLVVLAIGMLIVRHGTVPGWERWTFRRVNDLPEFLYRPLWPFQQLGNIAVGPVVALDRLVLHQHRLAIASLLATIGQARGRNAWSRRWSAGSDRAPRSVADVHLRGDVGRTGESFVSGHAVLAAALAGVITPYLRGRWKLVPWVVVAW